MIPHKDECIAILMEMLAMPLDSADAVFEKFAALPGAIYKRGNSKQERFLYIPGSRKDRVLLVSHADTFWDSAYPNGTDSQTLIQAWPEIRGANHNIGIGADDRAGCAMLYALKDSGHSLLIMDSEEKYKISHRFLKESAPKLLRELNSHCYMLEVDLPGFGYCSSARIPNTKQFVDYINAGLNTQTEPALENLGTDITQLCTKICGANISCGYYHYHKGDEFLQGEHWCTMLYYLNQFLQQPQKRFPIHYWKKYTDFILTKLKR